MLADSVHYSEKCEIEIQRLQDENLYLRQRIYDLQEYLFL